MADGNPNYVSRSRVKCAGVGVLAKGCLCRAIDPGFDGGAAGTACILQGCCCKAWARFLFLVLLLQLQVALPFCLA